MPCFPDCSRVFGFQIITELCSPEDLPCLETYQNLTDQLTFPYSPSIANFLFFGRNVLFDTPSFYFLSRESAGALVLGQANPDQNARRLSQAVMRGTRAPQERPRMAM